MTRSETCPLDLPLHLQKIYGDARRRYIDLDYEEALRLNKDLLQKSTLAGCPLGEIIGWRFIGLCHFRRDELDESTKSFETARTLARKAGEREQELLIQNHLAATLRRSGKLQKAYDLLADSLEVATLKEYPFVHSRLLGSMGALLDQLGQRAAADDCYARFEVIERMLGNPHRLANAVGLAARAAELRGAHEAAEKKYAEEAHLAAEVKDRARQIAATLHQARMAASRNRTDVAEALFKKALRSAKGLPYEKRYIDALESYGNFLRDKRRDLPAAHWFLHEALKALENSRDRERLANVNYGLALVCRDAGLYGESLVYLRRSVKARAKLYKRLLPALRKLAQPRFDELKDLTKELVDTALPIPRSPDEKAKLAELEATLKKLVNEVHRDPTAWDRLVATAHTSPEPYENLIEKSRAIWSERLLPGRFALPQSQTLLERAERSYSSAVDDLGRSTHLLVLVLERELKQRLFDPIGKDRIGLGGMLERLKDASTTSDPPPDSEPLLPPLYDHVRKDEVRQFVVRICDVLKPIKVLEGKTLPAFVEVRNVVAHGDEEILASLGRLQVDAIKRHLALTIEAAGGLTILQALSQLPPLT